ncbi:hypothetical protein CRG98_028375 [Punica granatum]|uniref:Uncharacterized protein n=1 Tax=Punica granatum TaxID=22663 RepID=A0A2I0J4R2_PUNGR|nr:hypothetical protein CRG98_028375 [Punica granatum]
MPHLDIVQIIVTLGYRASPWTVMGSPWLASPERALPLGDPLSRTEHGRLRQPPLHGPDSPVLPRISLCHIKYGIFLLFGGLITEGRRSRHSSNGHKTTPERSEGGAAEGAGVFSAHSMQGLGHLLEGVREELRRG